MEKGDGSVGRREIPIFEGVRAATSAVSSDKEPSPARVRAAIDRIYQIVEANFARGLANRSRSKPQHNWRGFHPNPKIAAHNESPEVTLERALVKACVDKGRKDWWNQVPVLSGLASARRCAIDLVWKRGACAYDFVELKVGSDSPRYAAIEIIQYGFAWLFSRAAKDVLKYPNAVLLEANDVALCILAPKAFYAKENIAALRSFQVGVNQSLTALPEVKLSFRFEQFRDDFKWAGKAGQTDLCVYLDDRRPI